jgi:hypothetical protein
LATPQESGEITMSRRALSATLLFVSLLTALCLPKTIAGSRAGECVSAEPSEATWTFDKHEDSNGNPKTNVFLIVGGRRVLVRRNVTAQFTSIAPEDYRSHGVPASAIAACQGWWAGAGEDLYVIRKNRQLIVFIRYLDEGSAPGRFRRLKVIQSPR